MASKVMMEGTRTRRGEGVEEKLQCRDKSYDDDNELIDNWMGYNLSIITIANEARHTMLKVYCATDASINTTVTLIFFLM